MNNKKILIVVIFFSIFILNYNKVFSLSEVSDDKIRREIDNIKKMDDFNTDKNELVDKISEFIEDFEDKSSNKLDSITDEYSFENQSESVFFGFIKVFFQIMTIILILLIIVFVIFNIYKLLKSKDLKINYKYSNIKPDIEIKDYKDSFYLSKEAYKNGESKLACIYLYRAFILKLCKEGYLNYNKSKTNSQYYLELRHNNYKDISYFKMFTNIYNDIYYGKLDFDGIEKKYLEYLAILKDD
jgi:ABC-type multidrug transport system fused ATPase/permease subunit